MWFLFRSPSPSSPPLPEARASSINIREAFDADDWLSSTAAVSAAGGGRCGDEQRLQLFVGCKPGGWRRWRPLYGISRSIGLGIRPTRVFFCRPTGRPNDRPTVRRIDRLTDWLVNRSNDRPTGRLLYRPVYKPEATAATAITGDWWTDGMTAELQEGFLLSGEKNPPLILLVVLLD